MFFFEKRGTKNFATPYLMSVPYLGVLPKNKSLYNFHRRVQRVIAGCIKGLDLSLVTKAFCKYPF